MRFLTFTRKRTPGTPKVRLNMLNCLPEKRKEELRQVCIQAEIRRRDAEATRRLEDTFQAMQLIANSIEVSRHSGLTPDEAARAVVAMTAQTSMSELARFFRK